MPVYSIDKIIDFNFFIKYVYVYIESRRVSKKNFFF